MVKLTDRPDMTLDVDRRRKTTTTTTQRGNAVLVLGHNVCFYEKK